MLSIANVLYNKFVEIHVSAHDHATASTISQCSIALERWKFVVSLEWGSRQAAHYQNNMMK